MRKVLIVAGIGDNLCGASSKKRIRDAETFVSKVQTAVNHLQQDPALNGVVQLGFSSDTTKEVNVFENVKDTQLVKMGLHSKEFLNKDNELCLLGHDSEKIRFAGTEFEFVFPSKDYEVLLCGIDLHGIFGKIITELTSRGYTVKLFSDASSVLQDTRRVVNDFKGKSFQFCSYKSA